MLGTGLSTSCSLNPYFTEEEKGKQPIQYHTDFSFDSNSNLKPCTIVPLETRENKKSTRECPCTKRAYSSTGKRNLTQRKKTER